MNPIFRNLAAIPFRFLPAPLRRRVIQAGLHAAAARPPREAMGELLTIDADMSGLIDQTALAYDEGVHVKHRLMRYHDFFVERVGAGDRVLDVGCGYGAVANSIATKTGAQVTGIDMDESNIATAKSRFSHPSLTFINGMAPRDLPEAPYDVIVLSNVLEHVEHRVEFLAELRRKTGASRLLIRVPMIDRDWRVPLRAELGLFHFSDPTHFTEYTRTSFEAEMVAAHVRVKHLQINWGEIWAEVVS